MKKCSFIPPSHRPDVPGSRLTTELNKAVPAIGNDAQSSIVLIASKEDRVMARFVELVCQQSANEPSIGCLFYEDLGQQWHFSFHRHQLVIVQGERCWKPQAIYHRHPGATPDHPKYALHIAFLEALERWKGHLLGQRRSHFHNSSKPYQLISSLQRASCMKQGVARLPHSFIVKGTYSRLKSKNLQLVVKSLSAIRSQVVGSDVHQNWNESGLHYLPTLFQESLSGDDLRVHMCVDNVWALRVTCKGSLDYRYAPRETVVYEEEHLHPRIQAFCESVLALEANELIGIDFIVSPSGVYCLEANPAPGWSTYRHPSRQPFANTVLNWLRQSKQKS